MKKEELINVLMEFINVNFPELIDEEKKLFKNGDTYYCIFPNGGVSKDCWDDCEVDRKCLSIGNAFKSEYEANFYVEKLKVLHELEMLGRSFDNDRHNYTIMLDSRDKKVEAGLTVFYNQCFFDCYFDSREEAQEAINKIGEDRIRNYLFGVL